MVSVEPPPPGEEAASPITSSPRISFSSEFLDDSNFICINPVNVHVEKDNDKAPRNNVTVNTADHNFEFSASSNAPSPSAMLTADELFFEGKLLPFWQKQCAEKLGKISLGGSVEDRVTEEVKVVINNKGEENSNSNSNRMSWFIDEDPSPRPPKCTVLWKELLRLKKQRSSAASSTLSPSSSTSSSSSSSSSSIHELAPIAEGKEGKQNVKRVKKGLERTRSASIRIRPVVSVPEGKGGNSGLPPLFTLRKLKLDR